MAQIRFPLPLLAALALVTHSAAAQTRASGFSLNRFDPSERGSDWFVAESLDFRGDGRLALGLVANYAHNPLVIYDRATGDKLSAPIANQLYGNLGGSLILNDRWRVALDLPILLYQNGDAGVVGGQIVQATQGAHLGDLRLGLDVLALGRYQSSFSLAFGVHGFLPTGSKDAFTSDGNVRVAPRALLAGELGPFVYAARLEYLIRPNDKWFAGSENGDSLYGAAAAGVRVKNLVLGPELAASTGVSNAKTFFKRTTTPAELLFGAHYRAGDFKIGAGIGPGLSRGLGAPDLRILGSVEWFPEPAAPVAPPAEPKPDGNRDHDSIRDSADACPEVPGVTNVDPRLNGCPVPDRDHDEIADVDDACPDEPGIQTNDAKTNGCPAPRDTDKDSIIDVEDACPNEPGIRSEDPKTNGCPAPKDTDKDGIIDAEDACPDAAGPKTSDPKTNGCPTAHLEQNEIRIMEPVKFATGSDRILNDSEVVLTAVLEILKSHPEITKLEVRGHTDNRGGAAMNLKLSGKRAASVQRWLTEHGIASARLSSQGFGMKRPIDGNDTEEGRRNNRRVEFRIIETSAQP